MTKIREIAPNTKVTIRSSMLPRNGQNTTNAANVRAAIIKGMMGTVPGEGMTVAAMNST